MKKIKKISSLLVDINQGAEHLLVTDADIFHDIGFKTAIGILKNKENEYIEFIQDIMDGKLRGAEARRIAEQKFT